jgi:hypothetical protein
MPHYEFFCRACKKTFSRVLALVDWAEERLCVRTVGAMRSSNCGRPSRFLRPRSAPEGCLLPPGEVDMKSGHFSFVLSIEEDIPWKCRQLVIGTGAYGRLPVMDEVKREARRRNVELLVLPTSDAIEKLRQDPDDTNAILHVTC